MIKATDLIKKETVFTTKSSEYIDINHASLRKACKTVALRLVNNLGGYKNYSLFDPVRVARADKIAKRFEREFLREDIFEAEENIFYFTLWLHHNPTLREVIQAFREGITFHGNVNINSINEIKKDFKENYSRTSDIRELFNKGYGAYLVKASFSKGDFEEPSYWDLEIISHYKF